jgi:hypothetical protein
VDDLEDEFSPPTSESNVERVGDDDRGPVKKFPLFTLNFDSLRVVLGRDAFSVAANSDSDLCGGGGSMGVWPVQGFGRLPRETGILGRIACMNAASMVLDEPGLDVPDAGEGILTFAPVGSSRSCASRSTSLTNTAKICWGRWFAMVAYSSKSCSPVSPMRINRESGK